MRSWSFCILISDGCIVEGLSEFRELFWKDQRSNTGVWEIETTFSCISSGNCNLHCYICNVYMMCNLWGLWLVWVFARAYCLLLCLIILVMWMLVIWMINCSVQCTWMVGSKVIIVCQLHTPNLHLASSEQWCWSGGRGILTELSLCDSIV